MLRRYAVVVSDNSVQQVSGRQAAELRAAGYLLSVRDGGENMQQNTSTQDATQQHSAVNNPQTYVAETRTHNMSTIENKGNKSTLDSAEFGKMAMSILQDVPASLLATTSDKPQGNSAANAKTLVDSVKSARQAVTFDDVQTWTYTRKKSEPTVGTWREAITAIKQAVTTTKGNIYLQRPTRGGVEVKLHNISVSPLEAAKVIVQDAMDVKRLGAKGMTDNHRSMIADMQNYLTVALKAMSDEQREEFAAWTNELQK